MDITFKIKTTGKILTTPNLEKKLKRMKLTLDDIEIVEKEEKPKKLIKDLRHLTNCLEASYGGYGEFYFDTREEIPESINGHSLVSIRLFNEWMNDYCE